MKLATLMAISSMTAVGQVAGENVTLGAGQMNPDERRYERMYGELWTIYQFRQRYGSYDYASEWRNAPLEKRIAQDRREYTINDFFRTFRYARTSEWYNAPTATQVHMNFDGREYTMDEFVRRSGSRWIEDWAQSEPRPCMECCSQIFTRSACDFRSRFCAWRGYYSQTCDYWSLALLAENTNYTAVNETADVSEHKNATSMSVAPNSIDQAMLSSSGSDQKLDLAKEASKQESPSNGGRRLLEAITYERRYDRSRANLGSYAWFMVIYPLSYSLEWDRAPVEKRVARDGKEYSITEFQQRFGPSWVFEWRSSAISSQLRHFEDENYEMQDIRLQFDELRPERWATAEGAACSECCGGLERQRCGDRRQACVWSDSASMCVAREFGKNQLRMIEEPPIHI